MLLDASKFVQGEEPVIAVQSTGDARQSVQRATGRNTSRAVHAVLLPTPEFAERSQTPHRLSDAINSRILAFINSGC